MPSSANPYSLRAPRPIYADSDGADLPFGFHNDFAYGNDLWQHWRTGGRDGDYPGLHRFAFVPASMPFSIGVYGEPIFDERRAAGRLGPGPGPGPSGMMPNSRGSRGVAGRDPWGGAVGGPFSEAGGKRAGLEGREKERDRYKGFRAGKAGPGLATLEECWSAGQPFFGRVKEESRLGGRNDESRSGEMNDETRLGGRNGGSRLGGMNDESRLGGRNGGSRLGEVGGEPRGGGTNKGSRYGGMGGRPPFGGMSGRPRAGVMGSGPRFGISGGDSKRW